MEVENKFLFNDFTTNNFKDELYKLDPKNASIENDITTKILIKSGDIVCGHLTNIYNNSKRENKYPQSLKVADVTSIHKREERTLMQNYRPVSLIPTVSKLSERNMYNQILAYNNKFLSQYLLGYRTRHSTEQCLIVMLKCGK